MHVTLGVEVGTPHRACHRVPECVELPGAVVVPADAGERDLLDRLDGAFAHVHLVAS